MIDSFANSVAGVEAIEAAHQQFVIAGMSMADGRDRRGCDGPFVEGLPCSGPTHSAAAARRRVRRYGKRLGGRTARKQFPDRIRHAGAQIAILFDTAHLLALAPSRPRASVLVAFVFGFLEGGFFDQDALAFIVAPGPAESEMPHRTRRTASHGEWKRLQGP